MRNKKITTCKKVVYSLLLVALLILGIFSPILLLILLPVIFGLILIFVGVFMCKENAKNKKNEHLLIIGIFLIIFGGFILLIGLVTLLGFAINFIVEDQINATLVGNVS